LEGIHWPADKEPPWPIIKIKMVSLD
jgi:hypothetical protein